MRRELRAVLDELFGSHGAEIFYRSLTEFNLSPGRHALIALQRAADARGEIAMGIRWAANWDQSHGGVELNPARSPHVPSTESAENTLRCGEEIVLLRQIAGRDRDWQHHEPATAGIVQFLQTDVA